MSSSQQPAGDACSGSQASQLRIVHDESNTNLTVTLGNPELGLKKLLRAVIPKIRDNARVSGDNFSAVLSYLDDDGDVIHVRTDSDLKEAIRLARDRQISMKIAFEDSPQPNFGLDSSIGANGVSWPDTLDPQNEDPTPDAPSVIVQEPRNPVSLLQPAALEASLQSSVVDSQRILHLEQALQQCVCYVLLFI
jgi:hypothetical protein